MNHTAIEHRKRLREQLATCIPSGFADDDRLLLEWARSQGLLMIDALVLLRIVHGISLGNAKDRVFASEVWADQHAAINQIHTQIERALDEWDTAESTD